MMGNAHLVVASSTVPATKRRIYTADRKRQRSSLLLEGTEFNIFLAALAIFYKEVLKKTMNSSFLPGAIHPFLQIILVQISTVARQGI